jgi:signal transduction histidine kinase
MDGRAQAHQSDGHGRLVRSVEGYPSKSRPLRGHFGQRREGLRALARSVRLAAQFAPVRSAFFRRVLTRCLRGRKRALARSAHAVAVVFGAAGALAPAKAATATLTGPQSGIAALWLLGAASVGALIALTGVVLAQQQRSRRELNALRQSLAASATWSWRTNADGIVVDVERSHRAIDWFDCTALLGRRPWEITPGASAPPALATALAACAPYFDVRLDVDGLEGRPVRILALSGAPMFSGTGTFRGHAGAVHDLTSLLGSAAPASRADVERLQADLEQRNRQLTERSSELEHALRELDSFSYSVSHDLRAPLRIVDGFATIVLEDYGDRGKPLDELGRDHLRRIVAAGQRMNSMIETLLSLSRTTSRELARERVDLTQVARELADDLRAQDHTRAVEFVIESDVRVDGDGTLLRLVLQNLLGNAWKFTARTPQARIEFGVRKGDGAQTYFVRDNGAGFDMRFAEKLFGLFQRFHSANEFPGTGVGLATVQKIVRRHGGRIWAEAIPAPNPGHGATFYFTLWE